MIPQPLNVRFPCTPRHATRARQAFRVYLALLHLDSRTEFDLESAIGEAITSVVERGYSLDAFFELRVRLESSDLTIEIEDRGRENPVPAKLERPADSRDYGLNIMRALVDDVEMLQEGRLVRLHKKVRASRRPAGKSVATPGSTG
jgi:anti-sigma regulatory factor (Ser/Thr protein kinase)